MGLRLAGAALSYDLIWRVLRDYRDPVLLEPASPP
jgi:hypothetical protein